MPLSLLFTAVAIACAVTTWRRTATEPRRGSNLAWMTATAVSALATLLAAGKPTTLIDLAATLTVAAPIMAIPLVLFLLNAGLLLAIPDGRKPGNAVCGAIGIAAAVALPLSVQAALNDAAWLPLTLWLSMTAAWLTLLCTCFLVYSEIYRRSVHTETPDYIVVLGAGLVEDRVSPLLGDRVDLGVQLYRDAVAHGHTPLLIMSGGQGPDEVVAEADAMAQHAIENGLEPRVIVREKQSTNTEENLRYASALMRDHTGKVGRGLAVTSDFHTMRTAMLAHRLGLNLHATGARSMRYVWSAAVLRECAAVIRDSLPWQIAAYALVILPLPCALATLIWWQ